jgi:hypothetical protein
MSKNIQKTITTANGIYEYTFSLFCTNIANNINNIVRDNLNINTLQYLLYSDIELTNLIGYLYYSGQTTSFSTQIVQQGVSVFDLQTILNLGTFTTPYSFVNNQKNIITTLLNEQLNNSVVTGGTGDFAFSHGDLIVTNTFAVTNMQEVLYYKKK